MKKIIPILLVLTSIFNYSQERIAVGDKTYEATPEFEYIQKSKTNGYYSTVKYQEIVKISIGKKSNGGLILLQKLNTLVDSNFNHPSSLEINAKIEGNLFLYLSNGEIIKCLDRKIRGYMDNISSSLYYLTNAEIDKLMKYDIISISYSLNSGLSDVRSYSADNIDSNTAEFIRSIF